MQPEGEKQIVALLTEILRLARISSHSHVKAALLEALPDQKSRIAYQMFDGKVSSDGVRVACKLSPNVVAALTNRCTSMGLMETNEEKRRIRLFDLTDFGLLSASSMTVKENKS